jgi:CMP-N-acetylneuraminic acid synthetase
VTRAAFIFARGGSKGVPRKNIAAVAGKPLIAHSIEGALKSKSVNRVIVSTDDPGIAKAARDHGAEVLDRPAALASDTAPELLSWRHAIDSFPALFARQPFISLPATSPLRAPQDIDAAVARFEQGGCDLLLGISPAHRNPYLNMVTADADGMISLAIPGSQAARRQDVPLMYDVTTCVYVADPAYVLRCQRLLEGRVGHVLIPPERALDVDTPFDLYLANLMLKYPYNSGS